MHHDPERMPLEVDAILAEPVARQCPALARQAAEGPVFPQQLRRQAAELSQHLQLQVLGQLGQLGRARRVE
ncbi:MAG: hypothetical protein ACK559_10970, partial [bacterium]